MMEPRPLFAQPFDQDFVVLVEGEKCAAAVIAAGIPATTWAGGAAALHKTDFSPLAGKIVVLWPDNDDPGRRAIESITKILIPITKGISIVQIPPDRKEGWDAADTTTDEILRLVSTAVEYLPPAVVPFHEVNNIFDDEPEILTECDRVEDLPFRCLGMTNGEYAYLPDQGMKIITLTAGGHSKLNMFQLAPLQEWQVAFPGKSGTDWDQAADRLLQFAKTALQFDPRRIRGRGCWIDGQDVVFHSGDKLTVNGRRMKTSDYNSPSRAIYEGGLSIKVDLDATLRNADAAKLIGLCESLSWEQPLFGKLLAGWLALAPICGALPWRPHIWLSGAAGSGKTWVMTNIITTLLGESALQFVGNTTEAGIRGRLGSDAMPVTFDEAESENLKSIARMDGVLELARQASSESEASIVKGTQNGGSISYMVRSMFCFASIGVAAVKKADTSRLAVLNLKPNDSPEQFVIVRNLQAETVAKPSFCAGIRARSIKNAMTIRHNAATFSTAAVPFTGDKRSADQMGTLLAGAYSLTSTNLITHDDATEWLKKQEWSKFKSEPIDSDENQCLAHLLAGAIRLERKTGVETVSIDEAIDAARAQIIPDVEHLTLQRLGVKVESDYILIANQHQGLEKIFTGTPWAGAKWRGQLIRMPGAMAAGAPVRFGPTVLQRAVKIPL
jgi:putative DNA primase/helicase